MTCRWGDCSPAQQLPEKSLGSGVQLGWGDPGLGTFPRSLCGTRALIRVPSSWHCAPAGETSSLGRGFWCKGPMRHLLMIKLSWLLPLLGFAHWCAHDLSSEHICGGPAQVCVCLRVVQELCLSSRPQLSDWALASAWAMRVSSPSARRWAGSFRDVLTWLLSFQWMKDMWRSDPCYADYGVDGSTCSFFIYLSEVSGFGGVHGCG